MHFIIHTFCNLQIERVYLERTRRCLCLKPDIYVCSNNQQHHFQKSQIEKPTHERVYKKSIDRTLQPYERLSIPVDRMKGKIGLVVRDPGETRTRSVMGLGEDAP
jgi:hypothetical protein